MLEIKGVKLSKGRTAFWDPKSRIHLTVTNNKKLFTEEELKNLDLSNIISGINTGVLSAIKKKDNDTDNEKEDKDNKTEESQESSDDNESNEEIIETTQENDEDEEEEKEDTSNEEEEVLEALTDDNKPRCQGLKKDGAQCSLDAKYPEDDPKYCGIHNKE